MSVNPKMAISDKDRLKEAKAKSPEAYRKEWGRQQQRRIIEQRKREQKK